MFGEVAFALAERTTVADYSNMKPALVHPSPTVPAAFAGVLGILLAVFLLPGAGIQGEPITLSPAIGGGAGRVAADLPATAYRRASEPVGGIAFPAQLGATRIEHFALQPRQAASEAHRVNGRARTGAERRAPSAPVQVAAPATPLTARRFGASTKAKGEARGHGGRLKPAAGGPAPGGHGHGKGSGGSSGHHHGLPPRHTNRAPTAPPDPAPATPPKANGGGNGGKGGKK